MTWYYQDNPINELPEDCVGFVYLITNTATGKMYVGKKLAKFSKTTYKTVKLKNGNGQSLKDVCNYVETIVNTPGNTCIEEIVSWVNFDYNSNAGQ